MYILVYASCFWQEGNSEIGLGPTGSTIKEMNTEYFKLILKAEEKNNMLLVVQGNALKRKSEEKEGHLGQLKKRMLELQEKKQTMH